MPTDAAIARPPQAPEVNTEHPWLGLLPYKEEHREFFFGRDREVEDILGRIRDNSLTILYGQSGWGKSSLLAAGVVPRLREMGFAPKIIRLRYSDRATMREQMLAKLPNRPPFTGSSLDPGWQPGKATLWELFHRKTSATPEQSITVLIFDQFEEIFTLGAQPDFVNQVADWLEQMADLLQNRPPRQLAERFVHDAPLAEKYHFGAAPVRIVFTLREDYLAQLERWKSKLPLLMQNRMALTLLSGPQARQAVLGPAQLGDHSLASREVAESIVRRVAGASESMPLEQIKAVPPFLSLLCEQLNAARFGASGDVKHPRITAEMVHGDSDTILQDFYEKTFLRFEEPHGKLVRAWVEDSFITQTEPAYRNTLIRSEAEGQLARAGVAGAKAIFDTLIQRRLITAETRDQVQRLEITHDVLVPLLLRSRKERQDREAKELAERVAAAAKAEQGRLVKERLRRRFMLALAVLSLAAVGFAVYGYWQASLARKSEVQARNAEALASRSAALAEAEKLKAVEAHRSAIAARQVALESAEAARIANAKNLTTLHEASMADYAIAIQRIEMDGKWDQGLVHLARSLKWEPENTLAATRLYSTLSFYAVEKQSWPREIFRHDGPVHSAQFSVDGTRIVTASADKTARVWDAATGKPIGQPLLHAARVNSAQFSPDGTRIVTASQEPFGSAGEVRVWDATTGNPIGEPMLHEDNLMSVQFSPDGTRIITVIGDDFGITGEARIWNAATGKPIGQPMRHTDRPNKAGKVNNMLIVLRFIGLNSAQFSPDGTRIVTASKDNTAQVWEAASGKPIGEPLRHEASVWNAQFSPDGTRIVTASEDKTARVWDATSGKPIGEPLRHEGSVWIAQFSVDGTRIITASTDKSVRVWDAASGKSIGEPLRHEDNVVSAQFSADGMRIVTASSDKSVRVWDAASGKPLGEPLRHEDNVTSAQFSPDGTRIVTASTDTTARVWDAASGKPQGEPLRYEDSVNGAQFSVDGTRIVTTSASQTARVWDAASGKPVSEPLLHANDVVSAQFSPDGTRIVTASADKTARVWNAANGEPLGEPLRHEAGVNSAQFSADGMRIVTASADKTARVWDAASSIPIGEPLRHEDNVNSAQFSADGTRIVTASADKTARVWDVASGKPLGEPLRHEATVWNAQFSLDGKHIVTASWDKTARMWDAVSGKPIGEPLRHEDNVNSAQFSMDGTRIVTASLDKTARMWDAVSGKPIGEPLRHDDSVVSAQFDTDGTRIITASTDKTARVWDTLSGKPLGEPLRHEAGLFSAQFSTDGTRIVTASADNTARVWEVKSMQHLPLPVPESVLQRVRAIAGLDFDSNGQMKAIPVDQRLTILREPSPGNEPWAKLCRWLVQAENERPLTPDSAFTFRQIAERERDAGTKEGLESALRYDPTVPWAHLLLAEFESNPQRAAFMRGYMLKRLPEDPILLSKISRSLVNQKQSGMALEAARKAVAMDASQIAAQRALAYALAASGQQTEALKSWDKVLANKAAIFDDFCNSGYLAAELNQGDKARTIFREGEKRFPMIPRILRFKGKALLLLHAPAEALAALQAYEAKMTANNLGKPQVDAIAALSVSRWLTGDKTGAVADYLRLIDRSYDYASDVKMSKSDWPEAIKKPMLEILEETMPQIKQRINQRINQQLKKLELNMDLLMPKKKEGK